MYNQIQKEKYIELRESEVKLPNNYLLSQFNKSKKHEELINKDISNFDETQIVEYYKSLNIASLESLTVINSQLSMYTHWCLQNNLVNDNQNHFLNINIEILYSCINKAVFVKQIVTKEEVLNYVSQLPNESDQFIMLGLFEGIKGKEFCELVHIKLGDIKGRVATLVTGRDVMISDRLYEIAVSSDKSYQYYPLTGNEVKVMPLVGDTIIKNYPNISEDVSAFQLGRRIYNKITRSLNYVGVLQWLSANSLYESGKINMVIERSKFYGVSAQDYVYSENFKEVEKQYNSQITRSTFLLKYGVYFD